MMKKHESIMRRVRFIEEKYGIKYAQPEGKLFKGIKIFYTLLWVYTLVINLMFIAGMLLIYAGTDNMANVQNYIITACAGTAVLIVGFVLHCTSLKATGAIVSIAPLPLMCVSFGNAMQDDLGFLGFKTSYYWRHLCPMAVMAILLIWMLAIVLRARYKTDSQYKRIVNNLYTLYHVMDSDGGTTDITEEQWDEFLENYDPRDYKRQFAVQSEETEEKVPAENDEIGEDAK